MSAPDNSSIGWYFQSGGNPGNDTDALGGAPDFGVPIIPALNNFIHSPVILGTSNSYRGVGVFRQEASGVLANARITNRCGGIIPAATGTFSVVSTDARDTGDLWVCYRSSGAWVTEDVSLAGRTPVSAAQPWDADHWVVVHKSLTAPYGNLLLKVAGQVIGVVFGLADNPDSLTDISTDQCSTLYDVALATAISTAIVADNRKTDPVGGISAWAKATRWQGSDASLSVPGGDMASGQWIALVARLLLPGGLPKPFGGQLRFYPDLVGDPQA